MDFLVKRDDLHECRLDDTPRPAIEDGQALLEVSHFGLTSNNITYAMFGVAMNYWDFFPAPDGWGRVPTWGFATVRESRVEQLEPGMRVYGYLPPSSELIVQPVRVNENGFVDGSPHRATLPAAYNSYRAAATDPVYEAEREDQQMLLRPLFFTSYLLDDFLAEAELFGADTAVISSASSKTSSALAHLLSRRGGTTVVGLTSERSADFVKGLGVYDHVMHYGDAGQLPAGRAVYVDMAGDAAVRQAVHEHYGDELTHSAVIGATHHDKLGGVPDELPGPRPTFFFAPDRVAKRIADWGAQGLEAKLAEAWHPYVAWTDGWLEVVGGEGGEALEGAYLALLDGRIDAARADVLSLPR
jgi:NADPH:quinone reductase-like Zn-dependent oxidoreductase